MNAHSLDFYRAHSPFTHPGRYAHLFDALPDDVSGLVSAVQGLLIPPYPFILSLHGLRPGDVEDAGFGIRPIEATIERILAIHDAPLVEARPPKKRLGVNCRNFATLLVAMLRHKGIPARERVGFAGYLGGKINYEHRITEYWDTDKRRWVLVDAWIHDVQRKAMRLTFNTLDITPHDPFYLSGDVWLKARQNGLDANQFGDSDTEVGMPLIRYALLHDFDALVKLEVLGCDAWGKLIDKPETALTGDDLAYLDQVAALTSQPDTNLDALIQLHSTSDYGVEVRAMLLTLT